MIDLVFVHFCGREKPWQHVTADLRTPTAFAYLAYYRDALSEVGIDQSGMLRPNRLRRLRQRKFGWLYRRGIRLGRARRAIASWDVAATAFETYVRVRMPGRETLRCSRAIRADRP